ncbi:hypothetical protein M0R45_020491 [Rubus argutus]|uniref:HMA domain-containing protein n=1 Tax=Rubus argutus TaxID=59490 RepID=A0AAW1X907_RUBAR
MMQKIVVKVQVHCDKCRTKALKIAATAQGVSRVSIQGVNRDHLEVIGDGVDSVCLTRALRKKLGFATIVKVEQVRGSTSNSEAENPTPIQYWSTTSSYNDIQHPQIIRSYYPEYYHESSNNCCIM